jgi:hypothetical protein
LQINVGRPKQAAEKLFVEGHGLNRAANGLCATRL